MLARIHKAMEERDEGFTLIELLVVIIIIGILAAIAIPVFLSQRNKGYDSQAKSDVRNMATLDETYFTDNNAYAFNAAALTDYKPSNGVSNQTVYSYTSQVGANGNRAASAGLGNKSYCVQAQSQSGNIYAWYSWQGGLQANAGATCP